MFLQYFLINLHLFFNFQILKILFIPLIPFNNFSVKKRESSSPFFNLTVKLIRGDDAIAFLPRDGDVNHRVLVSPFLSEDLGELIQFMLDIGK